MADLSQRTRAEVRARKAAARGGSSRSSRRGRSSSPNRVRLKPHDPFELIRLIAFTQQDPRKATAELVQNALDAGAAEIRIERRRVRGETRLVIADDGAGVHPMKARRDALMYLAHNIGHSAKRGITAAERHRLMVQGQYGIGLLGFWSLGEILEIKSRVAGSETMILRLWRDSPDAELFPVTTPIDWAPTRTEIVVRELNERATRQLTARRLAVYLGSELRGQLLGRATKVMIHDRMARGLAPRTVEVVPDRYPGVKLELPASIDAGDFGSIGIELHALEESSKGSLGVSLFCRGSRVLERLTDVPELAHPPWDDPRLAGEVCFDALTVAAATRRGFVNDAAALAFIRSVEALAPLVRTALDDLQAKGEEIVDERLARDLRRIFAGVLSEFPGLELLAIAGAGDALGPKSRSSKPEPEPALAEPNLGSEPGHGALAGSALPDPFASGAPTGPRDPGGDPDPIDDEAQGALFPPGSLEHLQLRPERIVLLRGEERWIRATPRDGDRRALQEGVRCSWSIDPAIATLEPDGLRCRVRAGAELGGARVSAVASQGGTLREAEATLEVVDEIPRGRSRGGIPDPELVEDRLGAWRSRLAEGDRWQVNAAHRDFRDAEGRARLRYLASLYAKELLLKTHGSRDPLHEKMLEELAGLLAYSERNMPR